jgi:hypothetical protein
MVIDSFLRIAKMIALEIILESFGPSIRMGLARSRLLGALVSTRGVTVATEHQRI